MINRYWYISAFIVVVGALTAFLYVPHPLSKGTPQIAPNERLKASPQDIFSATTETKEITTYDDTGVVVKTDTVRYVKYLYKDAPLQALPGELVERRTANSRTVKFGNEITVFFDAVTPYYKDAKGGWYKTEYATTTPEAFDLQTKVSFLGIPLAHAQTFLVGSPGTGNQTWNVPSDWNNAANTIQCIGSGATGSDGLHAASIGGGGGGGGAYASISNLTLTPGGTATYAIGASATNTFIGVNNGSARETYFNGTASSTASLSCSWGKKNSNASLGGSGGEAAQSIGTTKYDGGTGGSTGTTRPGGAGGGGSAGPSGAGQNGGSSGNGDSYGAGGGGSNGGSSSAGGDSAFTSIGAGGNGTGGTGGGATASADGTAGTGGGGAGADGVTLNNGGAGAIDTSFDATHGAGGGGGGGRRTTGSNDGSVPGGAGGTYGGGGGGGGNFGSTGTGVAAGGAGGIGIIVITYTPATPTNLGGNLILINNATVILP